MSDLHYHVQVVVNTERETSRGTVKLKSADPTEHPLIDPNYLATKDDIQDLRAGVRIARQVKSDTFNYLVNCSF
jgi:choline dehydrogenase